MKRHEHEATLEFYRQRYEDAIEAAQEAQASAIRIGAIVARLQAEVVE